jgi:hypothetical protein
MQPNHKSGSEGDGPKQCERQLTMTLFSQEVSNGCSMCMTSMPTCSSQPKHPTIVSRAEIPCVSCWTLILAKPVRRGCSRAEAD